MKYATQQGSAASLGLAGEFFSATLSRKSRGFACQAESGKILWALGRISPQSLLLLCYSAMMLTGSEGSNLQSWNLDSCCVILFLLSCHQRLLSCSYFYRADLSCDTWFFLSLCLNLISIKLYSNIFNRIVYFTLKYFLNWRVQHFGRYTFIVRKTKTWTWEYWQDWFSFLFSYF